MLAAYPWDQRPENLPLATDEVCQALAENGGSIVRASIRLKVGSLVLRKFIERSAKARAVIQEMKDRLCDRAADKLEQALEDEDARRQDWAIRHILNSKNGRRLGWSSADDATDPAYRGPLVSLTLPPSQWQDGTVLGPKGTGLEAAKQIIELTANPAPASSANGGLDE